METHALVCDKCGGALDVRREAPVIHCAYCGTPYAVTRHGRAFSAGVEGLELRRILDSTAATVYEEWVLRKRRELDAETKQVAAAGCQAAGAVGCLSPIAAFLLYLLVELGSRRPPDETPFMLLAGAGMLVGLWAVTFGRRAKDASVASIAERYETEAEAKRRALGIADDFMRQ